MNILDAAYHTVHDYKGGANALAPRMGIKSPAVLNSKVNPNTDTHHLTLVEASKLMALTNDYRILQSLNAQHGKVAINLPDIPECRDTALTDLVLSFGMKGGNVYTLFKEMMADGRITRGETSTEIGTQNLPRNLPIESKNKKDWLCSKKLREEITLADDSIEPETLMTAKWVEREKRAFEIYNQDKAICDELLNFYFADWLLHAYRTKYSQETKTGYGKTPAAEPKQLTEKQISAFAQKLAHHPEFASKQNVCLYIEDARQRTWFTGGREKAQGVGSVKRDAQIWEDWCTATN